MVTAAVTPAKERTSERCQAAGTPTVPTGYHLASIRARRGASLPTLSGPTIQGNVAG